MKWLMEFDKLTCKLAQLTFMLQQYDFRIVHQVGLVNKDATHVPTRWNCLVLIGTLTGMRKKSLVGSPRTLKGLSLMTKMSPNSFMQRMSPTSKHGGLPPCI